MFKGGCAKEAPAEKYAEGKGAGVCKGGCMDKRRWGTHGPACLHGDCAEGGVGTCSKRGQVELGAGLPPGCTLAGS